MKRVELETKIKQLIKDSLNLEDISIEDIQTDAPLFKDGLGLDSIDALELGIILKKEFGIVLDSEDKENYKYFYSVKSLAEFVADKKGIELE